MDKEFIPYEQALELKQLGFDEPCFGWYASDKSLIKDYVIKMNLKAPTFSQAFRFFREKHGLFAAPCTISYDSGPYLWYFEIDSTVLPFGTDLGVTDDFKTYEEAELACLRKLIEIVKNIKLLN